jgi:hypothetical protein
MADHALLAPSSAARWVACAGSVALVAACPPEPEGPEAAEGHAAHYVLAMLLRVGLLLGTDDRAENGLPIDTDMQAGAVAAAEYIRGCTAAELHVEEPVRCGAIHPECWGTPDVWAFDRAADVLHVWDYKYGHRVVEAFQNWQLLCYLIGIISQLATHVLPSTRIRLHIIQPRAYTPDGPTNVWEITGDQVSKYLGELFEAARRAMAPSAECVVNDECGDCPGRARCNAFQRATLHAISFAGSSVPFQLPPEAAGRELTAIKRAIKLLEARETGLAVEVETAVRTGRHVPGWRLAPGQSRLRWNDPAKALAMADLVGLPITKRELMTPRQALDLKLIDESVIFTYASRPPAALKLVADDSSQSAKVFSK